MNNPYKFVDPDGESAILSEEIDGIKEEANRPAENAIRNARLIVNTAAVIASEGVLRGGIASKGLKNASGNLDDAARAARTQRHGSPNLTQHARERMAGSRGDGQTISVDRVQEAIDKGHITSTRGPVANRRINAADSASGRGLQVSQDVRTNNVTTVIDKGSRR